LKTLDRGYRFNKELGHRRGHFQGSAIDEKFGNLNMTAAVTLSKERRASAVRCCGWKS
jgi:hypothetical protein